MNASVNNLAFLVLTFFAVSAHAQNSSELTCRSKAKEIAAQTYNSCVTEARNTQIDQIRKEYQKQLADLKAKYDKELKKVGAKTNAAETATNSSPKIKSTPISASTGSKPKATKGIAKSLPTRKETQSLAPAQQESQDDKSVVTSADESPSQNDAQGDLKMQLVPAPAGDNNTAATQDEQVY
jgi:hypothetical protein